MPATPTYGLPYPGTGDSPHGPNQIQALAEAVEALIATITPVTDRFATGATVSSVETTVGTITGAAGSTYIETLTGAGATACAFTFVAPPSGKIEVINTGQLENSASTQTTLLSFVIRTGGTIGSGTTFFAASDDDALRNIGGDETQFSYVRVVEGLTPGATYNIRQAFRTSGGGGTTATYSRKRLAVTPQWV